MACNNCLQEILAGEPFWEDETEGTAYHQNCRQAALDRRNKAEDERAALMARAEAAEAEATQLRDENAEAWHAFDRQQDRGNRLAARVAELEAAQGWQPVTITEPSLNVMAELIIVGYRGHDGYWHYPDGPEGLVIRGWRPVQVAATEENQQ